MIASFFGYIFLYNKHDPHHTQFEKALVLFITKELVPFLLLNHCFLEDSFLKQNSDASFLSRH
jgi:hypothetical protein